MNKILKRLLTGVLLLQPSLLLYPQLLFMLRIRNTTTEGKAGTIVKVENDGSRSFESPKKA